MWRLEILSYFYTDLKCTPNEEHIGSESDARAPELVREIYAAGDLDARKMTVMVDIKSADESTERDPYSFKVGAMGNFELMWDGDADPKIPDESEDIEGMIAVFARNGAQMLIGAMREWIFRSTCSGPFNSVFLPSQFIAPEDIMIVEPPEDGL